MGQAPAILMPPSTTSTWRRRVGHGNQIVRIVPDLLLRFERKQRCHPPETDCKRSAPARAAARTTKLETDLRKFGRAIFLVTTENGAAA